MEIIKKKVTTAFNKKIYLLGKNTFGEYEYLEEASWECGWYWDFGYIEKYTNNKNSSMSRGIKSHTHFDFDYLFLTENIYDSFINHYNKTTLNEKEIWKLLELMQRFYIAERYAESLTIGGGISEEVELSNYNCESEKVRINTVVIPEITSKIYELLS